MEFIDMFFVELHQAMKFGIFLFFVLIDLVFVLGGIICFGEWISSKIRRNRI